MCGPTPTFQGKIKKITDHIPNVLISGFDVVDPNIKHSLYFIDPLTTPVCNARVYPTHKIYQFHEDDYQDVYDWLNGGGKIKLFGEDTGTPPYYNPAGWTGA
ncbi:MAG TPA: hypothetical protein VFU02_12170 [Polyangiaceae bacterium]|nr:hypothetical protein [Polyangiaceae bacterium]